MSGSEGWRLNSCFWLEILTKFFKLFFELKIYLKFHMSQIWWFVYLYHFFLYHIVFKKYYINFDIFFYPYNFDIFVNHYHIDVIFILCSVFYNNFIFLSYIYIMSNIIKFNVVGSSREPKSIGSSKVNWIFTPKHNSNDSHCT